MRSICLATIVLATLSGCGRTETPSGVPYFLPNEKVFIKENWRPGKVIERIGPRDKTSSYVVRYWDSTGEHHVITLRFEELVWGY